MASKSDASAPAPAATEEQSAQPAAAEQQPEATVEAEPSPEPAPANEGIVEQVRDEAEKVIEEVEHVAEEVKAAFLKMVHPEGGSTDQYEKDEDGNHIVPAADVALMVDHGFTVVGTVQP